MELFLDIIGVICIFGLFISLFWCVLRMKSKHNPRPKQQPEAKKTPIKRPVREIAEEPKPARKFIVEPISIDEDFLWPEECQIVYIENEYDEAVNNFIIENYEAISSLFRYYGYHFCYMPIVDKSVNDDEIINYYAPYRGSVDKQTIKSDYLLKDMPAEERAKIQPSLLYGYTENCIDFYKRVAIELEKDSEDNFKSLLLAIINDINAHTSDTPNIRYSLRDNHAMYDFVQAEYPDMETRLLIKEIEERVAQLAQKGISERILEQIVSKPAVVSRMHITRDYRIILTDYNDMEIVMTPLVKAVYFLFLRHPEGIGFKHLIDYRTELQKIYEDLKGEPLDDKKMQSIIDATDPTKNSINEKCARIREAFVTRFDERLAENYIIQGDRGEPKRIPLHREFIEWQ